MDPLASFALVQIRNSRWDLASSALPGAPASADSQPGIARRRVAAVLSVVATRLDPTPVSQPRVVRAA